MQEADLGSALPPKALVVLGVARKMLAAQAGVFEV